MAAREFDFGTRSLLHGVLYAWFRMVEGGSRRFLD
jgi:hypothetical protein